MQSNLDTTREVVVRIDIEYKDDMEVALSPDEDQVAFLSNTLVTIYDIMHPEKCASFDFWSRKDAGRLSNPADFECSYSE